MSASEPFTFVEANRELRKEGYADYVDILSAKSADVDLQFSSRLRKEFPEMIVTTVPSSNINLLLFANLGYAEYKIELENDDVSRWRGYIAAGPKGGGGYLGEIISYARYKYTFGTEFFILFCVKFGYSSFQYVLKEPRDGETLNSHSAITDKLLKAAGDVLYKQQPGIFVFDNYWYKDTALYKEVQKAGWDKVILDPHMKEELTEVTEKFFDSKDVYDDLGVPWKRGLMFYGPPGNGKTISIKALMHAIAQRSPPVATLYVKAAQATYFIGSMFAFARIMSPCLLILEDIETIVTPSTRSYFFNEVDGLENNDGILMVASTNYLNRLDPGLTKRPSRFDRKYLFPLPNQEERVLYAEYWYEKLKDKKSIDFPKKLCRGIATITYNFSFAYIQEAFVATLLTLARRRTDSLSSTAAWTFSDDDDDLSQYEFGRVFKEVVKTLRKDMDSNPAEIAPTSSTVAGPEAPAVSTSLSTMPEMSRGEKIQFQSHRLPIMIGNDAEGDGRGQEFLSRWNKKPLMNRAAYEFRPWDDELQFDKMS